MQDAPKPKDHAEEVALFRAQVLGPLLCKDHERGELEQALRELSTIAFRPPGSDTTRTFGTSTLQRWYYAFRKQGLSGLLPERRSDRGHAKNLSEKLRTLLLEIRREYPQASVPTILRTLVADGRLEPGQVSVSTVRRLYAEHRLDRKPEKRTTKTERRRWQVERPGQLWHADVCHGPSLDTDKGGKAPLRIHAILDDASRFVVGMGAYSTEREVDMLELFTEALRRGGKPDTLYLDNGPTYRGEVLATFCGRLGITLLHAQPYDPQARGKMERFWRSARQGCLDLMGPQTRLHDVRVRLLAWLDEHYHQVPHASLMGRTPAKVWATRTTKQLSEDDLTTALTVRGRRRVRRDGTVSIGGVEWELDQGYLASRLVTVARTLYDPNRAPWVEHDDRRLVLRPVDPVANARRKRQLSARAKRGIDAVDFDPTKVLLDQALGRLPKTKRGAR
jgi:transposase InsO family protein